MSRKRRVTTMGSVVAVAVLPLALTTSAPTAPAAHVTRGVLSTDALAGLVPDRPDVAEPQDTGQQVVLEKASRSLGKKDEVEVSSPKGTRVWTVSALADHGLPVAAVRAYRGAAALMARTDPGCRLPWTLLAGIGRVESDHGRYGGSRLAADGVSHPSIIGVPLNGAGPVAAIHDTDDGRLDGDRVWDRAVGPMQFIPSTWQSAARDGDGDGRVSPHDLDDAAAAAASYLCAGSGSLLDASAREAAIYRYNQDDYYVALVQAFEVGYRTGYFTIPSPPVEDDPPGRAGEKRRHEKAGGHRGGREKAGAGGGNRTPGAGSGTSTSSTGPRPTGSSKPSTGTKPSAKPSPAPKPTPAPKPSPEPTPQPFTATGVLTQANGGYTLGRYVLDLGPLGQLAATALGDFDKDGKVETNRDELAGMLGKSVTMVVIDIGGGVYGIYSINGISLG